MCKRIAEEKSLTMEHVIEIINSHYSFVKNVVTSADIDDIKSFKTVKIIGLCKFIPKSKRIYKFNEGKRKHRENGST